MRGAPETSDDGLMMFIFYTKHNAHVHQILYRFFFFGFFHWDSAITREKKYKKGDKIKKKTISI